MFGILILHSKIIWGDEIFMNDEKVKALKSTIGEIEKKYGKGSIMKFGDAKNTENIDVVSSGCLRLDLALGVGGIPRGRIIEIFGPESSGKTTLALHIVAEVQKAGGFAGYVDAEHALDPIYARKIGVDIDELYISQPDDGEQALEIAEAMVRSSAIDVVVVDSVAALVPRAEIQGEMGDSHMGLQARLMSQALRKITAVVNKSNCIIIFINQLREKIGVIYGSNETTTGGRALKFYASVRMEIRRSEQIKNGTTIIGNRTKVKIAKNKVAPPFTTVEFDIMYGQGISREGDILDTAVELGIINKGGSWFTYEEIRLQGRESFKQYFIEHPEVANEVENKVRAHFGLEPIDRMAQIAAADAVSKNSEKEEKEEKPKAKKTTKKTKKADKEEEPIEAENIEVENIEALDDDELEISIEE